MKSQKQYWNGLEQLENTADYQKAVKQEFPTDLKVEEQFSEESLAVSSNRRDFLKIFGFGLTAATLAACETPVKKAIPYVIKPENVTPGVASWYATTCGGCSAACNLLVKSREGRPIKIEGNPNGPLSQGGTCAVGQSTLLSLYDNERVKNPLIDNAETDWTTFDKKTKAAISAAGGKVRIVSGTINSPTTQKLIDQYLEQFEDGKHVQYDSLSVSAIRKANEINFGKSVIPAYHFDKANVIVSFGADFLGTWISPVQYTKDYVKNRKLDPKNPKMSSHYQFEAVLSLTGTNADYRLPVDPSKEGLALLNLYNKLAAKAGQPAVDAPKYDLAGNMLDSAANALWANKGKSLIVCGTNDASAQQVVNAMNELLGNYGKTVDLNSPSNQANGDDEAMSQLVTEMNAGEVGSVILWGVNPAYNFADSKGFTAGLKAVKNRIAFALKSDETASLCNFVAPSNHFLESWGDANSSGDNYSITQPLVRPIFNTRQAEDNLLVWMNTEAVSENVETEDSVVAAANLPASSMSFYEYLKNNWEDSVFAGEGDFKAFWDTAVQTGLHTTKPSSEESAPAFEGDMSTLVSGLAATSSGMELVVYPKVGIRDGEYANVPWLQELPDPITKVCWDNYITIPYKFSKTKQLADGDLVTLTVGANSVELPVLVLPGMAPNTFGVAMGYGREKAGIVGNSIGKNAFPFLTIKDGTTRYSSGGASISAKKGTYLLAKTEYFMGYEMEAEEGTADFVAAKLDREPVEDRIETYILKDSTLDEYKTNRKAGNENRETIQHHNQITLWDEHKKEGHHWGMSIDLNACTGCGNCIVACHAENNVPMVGKQEVATRREMHWMRIDRYFKGDPGAEDGSLEVAHQPVMCQHCDNAPCETVCPVLATLHSDEGLNQQVYNRCVGTRYCANNCPYKVRRFNWFSYYSNEKFNSPERNAPNHHMFDKVGKMVLNPDVTVRARGVMEKCSMCVQRIQEGKLSAKAAGHKLEDGAIKTACQQSCPANAIVFGDMNDPNSELSKLLANERTYNALEEVKTLPSIGYMTKIRNKNKS